MDEMSQMVSKEYLIEILKENKVFEEGEFTLASGKKSNYYVNMKRAITEPEILSTNAYYVYKVLKERMTTSKVSQCLHSQVGLTEHILSENERVLVLINYSPQKVETDIILENGWNVSEVLYGKYDEKAFFENNIILNL